MIDRNKYDLFIKKSCWFFGLRETAIDSSENPRPGGIIRVESLDTNKQKAMAMVAYAATEELNRFLENQNDLRLTESKHFKGPKNFTNEASEDLRIAYLCLLKTLSKEVMEEIERTEA